MEFKKISVVIPLYNEAKNLPELIRRLKNALLKTNKEYELLFVDDNSTDDTYKIFQKRKIDQRLILLKKRGEKGKAYSLIEGFAAVTGDAVVMIDADLQYPPEAIPGMVKTLENADIVVANRKNYKDFLLRKALSRTFRFGFGKVLFGLDHDIQSGLKVFTRDVIQTINFNPASEWTFDLEMLHIARHAGYVIKNFDIDFEKRKNGHSNVNVIKTAFDIGLNSLKLRTRKILPITIKPKHSGNMIGAGVRYKKKLYVTHTTLPHHLSAMRTFTLLQKTIIWLFLLSIIVGLVLQPLFTLQALVALLSLIYFIDVFFNLFLILKSLSFPQEIVSSEEELAQIDDKDLPIYTILCPLYREAHVIPQFMNAINKLSYPKEKLDVILLLEEDDKESIESVERMKLPSFVRTIVVPHSMPKTKPKACNYGLAFARGEYLVIFDAEDIPEPMQLKKAFLGFKKVTANTICLQAKLNYYNPHQNLLTRFFTAEYSLWFDVTLTGLQSINTVIPLGGTSNHFRIDSLKKVEGWDPFNVTEDADLGMRLFKKGYKTAIIDSITLEEANSKYGNWLRQRSRWIKGYMQTYLVHIREAVSFTRQQGVHSLIFQLIIGGKIAFVLINPLLWLATIAYFVLYAFVGPQIEALYPSAIFYMAVVSLVFGNFLFLYCYMIGVAKKGQWNLMKFVLLIPVYWIMISVAAFIALYQLVFKPHYWEKTVHGFHLEKAERIPATVSVEKVIYPNPIWWNSFQKRIAIRFNPAYAQDKVKKSGAKLSFYIKKAFSQFLEKTIKRTNSAKEEGRNAYAEMVIESEEVSIGSTLSKLNRQKLYSYILSKKKYFGGLFLIASSIIANFLNFFFNAYLGRVLSLNNFALISLMGGLLSYASILLGAFTTTANFKSGFLIGEDGENAAFIFWKIIRRKAIILSLLLVAIWLLFLPISKNFFDADNIFVLVFFTGILLVGLANGADRGYLSAKFLFTSLAIINLVDPIIKLLVVFFLVILRLESWSFIAIPISVIVTFAIGWYLALRNKPKIIKKIRKTEFAKFPVKFFSASLLTGFASITFMSTDIILANHFLASAQAGAYALLSLVGKMTYYLGGLVTPFITPIISRKEGAKKDTKEILNYLLIFTFILTFIGFIFFGVFGYLTIPFLYGSKTQTIVPFLIYYSFGMMCFTISKVFVNYYLVKRNYTFTGVAILIGALQIILIGVFHKNVNEIGLVMTFIFIFHFLSMAALHIGIKYVYIFENNLADLLGLFAKIKKPYAKGRRLRILILNWRDTKHKWAGGAEVYVQELAKRWVKDGNTVTIFCGNDSENPRNEVIDGVQIYRNGGFYTVYAWAMLYYLFRFRGKYDVIIDSENGIPFFTPLYARIPKFLLIHHVHQEVFRKSLRWPLSTIALFLEARLMPLVYRNIQVITVSPSSKEEILKHKLTKKDPIIIYNGVDTNIYKPGVKNKNPLILYVGRLQYYKSLHVFIVAASKVLHEIPEAEFVIAGEGEEKANLIKFAEKLGILEKIKFLGKVTEAEKINLFQKAWVFVNPSLMEGWGITTIEANACGTPAIASNVPGLKDAVKDTKTGLLIRYGQYDGFAKAIKNLIKDNALRKKMSEESVNWANNFSWEESSTSFNNIISEEMEKASVVKTNKLIYVLNRIVSLF